MAQDIEQLNRDSIQAEYDYLFGDNYSFFEPSEEYTQEHGEGKLYQTGESEDLYYPSKRPVVPETQGINWMKVIGYGSIAFLAASLIGSGEYLRWKSKKSKKR